MSRSCLPTLPRIFIPASDKRELNRLAQRAGNEKSPLAPFLRAELNRADVFPDKTLPRQTVVMNSTVTYRIDWEPALRGTMVFPHDCKATDNEISLLSPLGVALLGLRRGDCMPFFTAGNGFRLVTVLDVVPPQGNQPAVSLSNSVTEDTR
ncbi:MAG: GreA/GreB family elongation factor [Proteobacteria bacterium]|nr:GreA/GreB family elongation factor [Pseudomonadota bacterium]